MVRLALALAGVAMCLTRTSACSNFAMENDYQLSVRTMDLMAIPLMRWTIVTIPQGTPGLKSSQHGYIGVSAKTAGIVVGDLIFAGINDAGVTCDLQTLTGTQYPNSSSAKENIDAAFICRWVLEGFASVTELKQGLQSVQLVKPNGIFSVIGGAHWVIRDSSGQGVVIEFLNGQLHLHDDNNDQGKTGFGIMTNEPPLPWHIENVKHFQWKQTMERSVVAIPGAWYPDERFLRIYLVKSGMPKPKTFDEAAMQAVHVLNTITVPMGSQYGTDSGKGEGSGDHTQFGVIYDHGNKVMYWRSQVNQNLQRLRLEDVTKQKQYLDMLSPKPPWFSDASSQLTPHMDEPHSSLTV